MGPREFVRDRSILRNIQSNNGCCISLEPLPYPEEYFDYVRMCDLGYAVPEDEVSVPTMY